MTGIITYFTLAISGRMPVILTRCFTICIWLSVILFPVNVFSQQEPEYDEISVFLDVPLLGGGEIDALIIGEEIFLPVTDLFDFLKIRNIPSPGMDSITGFFINQEMIYSIDRINNLIRYGSESFKLDQGDLVRTETNLYLRAVYFGKIFGLDCIFDFRNLSVSLKTRLELPVIREMRQEEMRRNMNRLKGEVKADTTIGRSYPVFHFGMADWSVIATEQINGQAETRLNLALGSIIAGGETTVSLNYNSKDPFTEKQQYYLWRYVNNDNRALRQVMAGKIATHATSSIYNPVVGVQFTNTPTTFRRSFGSYTLSDKTEPGWIVELYVNNVLVDFVKADASGFFTFEVPLVYGNSIVRLKFYGPWGEERTREQNITIPFNFIPKNTLEYTVSAGMVEDTLYSRFSRTSVNYGLTGGVTIGAGFEYLSSVTSGPLMPYVNASLRLASNLLFSGEYTHTVRAKGTLSYRLPSNLQVEVNYTKYDKDQKAINYNYLEERKAVVSMPIRLNKFYAYNRMTVTQLVLPTTRYTTGEWLLSGSVFGVNTNITTYSLFIGKSSPYVYSNLSLSFRFPAGLTIIPQAQYGYTDKKVLSAKLGLEKRVMVNGFLNLSYEQNFRNNLHMGELGFRYDFRFAQTGASVRQTDRLTTLTQYARGSLINDRKTGYLGTDNRTNVGKGGITIIPYLDINANGRRDQGEPKAYGLNLRASGGRIERSEKDTTIRVLSLEPYTDCFIELDQSSFDNISWRLHNLTLRVAVDPNMLKLIEIPVIIVGEASGTVSIDRDGSVSGLARLIINIYNNKDQKQAGRILTEEDGYFSFIGLAPGSYNVRIDSVQLRRLSMKSSPDSINFNITANIEGDFVDGLDFTVTMKTQVSVISPERKVSVRDTTYFVIHEVIQEVMTSATDSYAIQMGAFKRKANAVAFRKKLAAALGKEVEIFIENGFYKVRITGFVSRNDVDKYIPVLKRNGIKEMWVITLKGMQKHWMITTRQDTITESLDKVMEVKPAEIKPVKEVIKKTKQDSTVIEPGKKIETSAPAEPTVSIQVGLFRKKFNALKAQRRIKNKLNLPVEIIKGIDYYQVIITGFYTREETYKFYPELAALGYPKIYLIEKKKR
jgi:hypothetical protein